jgi:hypothetical protein
MVKLFIIILLLTCTAYGQDKSSENKGIGIEIGVGYNNLFYNYKDNTFLNKDISSTRNAFGIQPTARGYYNFLRLKWGVRAFLGYYNFGGNSETMSNGYKDKYVFKSGELGIIPYIKIKKFLRIGPTFKGQYIFDALHTYYGSANDPVGTSREWVTQNANSSFKKWALNAGVNAQYVYKHIIISLESWFGISNLNAIVSDKSIGVLKIRENNFRILVGYEF